MLNYTDHRNTRMMMLMYHYIIQNSQLYHNLQKQNIKSYNLKIQNFLHVVIVDNQTQYFAHYYN